MLPKAQAMQDTNMSIESEQPLSSQFPVAVIMGTKNAQTGRWTALRREPIAVVAGAQAGEKASRDTPLRSQSVGNAQFLCTGYTLRLHKDEVESYYFNLMGERPSIFVICSEDESGQLTPFLATPSYDEATAHTEVEEHVFSLPIPPEVYRWIEQFVLEYYRPTRKKKRKRTDWKRGN